MTLWLTGDLHLGHGNILRYCPQRTFPTVRDMDEFLVTTWNATVGPDDDVLVLGDMCLGDLDRSLGHVAQLHGRSIRLVVGNHDRPFRRNGTPRPAWERRYLDAGFTDVVHGTVTVDVGLPGPLLACHFPYRGDSHDEDRYTAHRPADDGHRALLHGHTHGRWRRNGRMIDVGVDAWGGRPVAAEEIADLLGGPQQHAEPLRWPHARRPAP